MKIENLCEWLADPGCFPQIRESNADLEIRDVLIIRGETKSTRLLLATFQIVPVAG